MAAKNCAIKTGLGQIDNLNRKYGVNQIAKAFKFADSPKANKQLAEKYGLNRTFILKVPKGTNIEDALKEYNAKEELEHAEPNYILEANDAPTTRCTPFNGALTIPGRLFLMMELALWELPEPI